MQTIDTFFSRKSSWSAEPPEVCLDRELPDDLRDHHQEYASRVELHDLRMASLTAPDGGGVFLATAASVEGWIRCDIPEPLVRDARNPAAQALGPIEAVAGPVTVTFEWTNRSNLATLRRLQWTRSDDPIPRTVRSFLDIRERMRAGDRLIRATSWGRLRVADDIDAVDLSMSYLASSLWG